MAKSDGERIFGHIKGVEVGATFASRLELRESGVHRPRQGGICGATKEGAESVVLSGGYEDEDFGDEIVYTGHGGKSDQDLKFHDEHQSLGGRKGFGNAALVLNVQNGTPVRVVRGAGAGGVFAPVEGLRYDGLYRVAEYWWATGRDGFRIVQFRLVQLDEDEQYKPVPMREDGESTPEPPAKPPATKATTVQRVIRSTKFVEQVKKIHNDTCQFCGVRLVVNTLDMASSEGAHIQALGSPHKGPDVPGNLLCLCPNCHLLFDNGALYLTDKLELVDGLTHGVIRKIRVAEGHKIEPHYVQQHRQRFNFG